MTPLIRETVSWVTKSGMDPTELNWFDISALTVEQLQVKADPLMNCRPPFNRCFVVSRGPSKSHASYDIMAIVVGDDPHEGIVVDVWKGPTNVMPRKIPTMLYTIQDEKVMYGPTEQEDQISEEDAKFVLGVLIKWYYSMMSEKTAYQPTIKPTFTNRRKIAEGKPPSYVWNTVVIDGRTIKCEHRGGTHASPRLHDRRGHLRRLPNGKNCWVKPCKVGDASKGVVFKDYQIQGTL
jgi:hypothetical protein